MTTPTLLTFGHGTAEQPRILELLHGAGVGSLVDVRRFPGSRRNPHVATDELAQWLPADGIGYRWEPRLGGRRATAKDAPETDPWWRVAAFRAYAAHTRSPEFADAMAELVDEVTGVGRPESGATVVMCSESLWWRCHRRLVSDVAVLLRGLTVEHLWHDGRRTLHVPSAGARVTDAGLVYDLPADEAADG